VEIVPRQRFTQNSPSPESDYSLRTLFGVSNAPAHDLPRADTFVRQNAKFSKGAPTEAHLSTSLYLGPNQSQIVPGSS